MSAEEYFQGTGDDTWPPSTVILSKFWIAPDSTDAVFANPVTFNRMQPRCPYCGERGCDCGIPV